MEKNKIESQYVFADTRPHYEMLDALRGVAALLVVWYHVFEGFAFAGGGAITTLNYGRENEMCKNGGVDVSA